GSSLEASHGAKEADLPDVAQVGAWENLGFGYFRLDPVLDEGSAAGVSGPGSAADIGEESPESAAPEDEAEVMVAMHRAVQALAEGAEPAVHRAARSAVNRFGPFVKLYGVSRALGFSLARGRCRDPKPGAESRAHRWLLASLLQLPGASWAEGVGYEELEARISSVLPAPEEDLLLARARWLRRFAELSLKPDGPAAPAEEVPS
ncbi:MAG: hypothetical protein KDD47_25850, partial [Acidobacteria bacterium]|nr:hypothetical protein [Acidobacteriota bacterium]